MYSGNAGLNYGQTLAWNCMRFLQNRASLYLIMIGPAHLLLAPHHGVLFKSSQVLRIVRNLGDDTWLVYDQNKWMFPP